MGSVTTSNPFKRKLLAAAVISCFASSEGMAANVSDASYDHSKVSMSASGNTLTITNTPNAIINWARFNIDVGETVRFVQQSSQSAVLNRVTGSDPSHILGALQSNGKVFLINPNGIMFGASARIDVNGLVASTLNLSDADFLAGKYNFNADRMNPGSVVNAGQIATPSGGFVYLLAPNVENSGVITTPSGEAILAAGNSIEIVDSTDPSQRVLVSATSKDINLSSLMTQSNGNIFTVLNSGKVSANTVVQDQTGKIYFKSAGNVQTTTTSVVEAKGDAAANGGSFIGFADKVGSYAGSLDASGSNGGVIETSGHVLALDPGISVRAAALGAGGEAGLWLLDPDDLTIDASAAATISASLVSTNVTLETFSYGGCSGSGVCAAGNGDIIFDGVTIDRANGGGSATSLTVNASRNIVFNGTTSIINRNSNASYGLTVNLNAGTGGSGGISNTGDLTLNGTSNSALDVLVQNGKTWTNSGVLNLFGKSQIDLKDTVVATFNNSGTVNIHNNTANWAFHSDPGAGATHQDGIINNSGLIDIAGSSNTSFEALFNNSSSGVVKIAGGFLSLQNAGTMAGEFDVASGSTLWIPQIHSGSRTFNGATIQNNGTLQLDVATTFTNSIFESTSASATGDLAVPTTNATYTGTNIFSAYRDLNVSGVYSGSSSTAIFSAGRDVNFSGATVSGLATLMAIASGGDLNIASSSLDATSMTLFGSNVNIAGSSVFGNTLTLATLGGDTTITDSSVDGSSFLGIVTNHLDVIGSSTGASIFGGGVTDIVVAGDLTLKANGSTASATIETSGDLGSAELPGISVGGSIFMTSGTGGAKATIRSQIPLSIYIAFPYLSSGGYFVDGVEGVVYNGVSGFMAGGLPAILDTNLHITYGGGSLASAVINLLDGGLLGASDLSATLNDAIAASTATEDDLLGTGDDEDKKEDKPQQCSA